MGKWEMVRLGDYIKQVRGVSYKPEDVSEDQDGNHIPVLRAHNIQTDGLNFNNLVYVNKQRIQQIQFIRRNDIVVCASSGSKELVGKAAQSSEDMMLSFGAFCKVVRPQKGVNPRYLKHYFNSTNYRKIISDLSSGANISNLRNEHIDELKIPLPPLPIQQKIADVLDKASALIEMRKAQIDKLDLLIKSQFIDMFGDPKDDLQRWSVSRIDDVVDFIEAGWSANGDARKKQLHEYGVLKVSAVTSGEFDESEYKVINEDIKKVVYPHKDDLLFSRANTRELVGATCIIRKDYPMLLLPDKLWRIRFSSKATCQYMKYLLSSKSIREAFSAESSGTSGSMYNISMQKFRSTVVPIPPKAKQKEFSTIVDQVLELKSILQESLAVLECEHKSLMQKCFSGEMF